MQRASSLPCPRFLRICREREREGMWEISSYFYLKQTTTTTTRTIKLKIANTNLSLVIADISFVRSLRSRAHVSLFLGLRVKSSSSLKKKESQQCDWNAFLKSRACLNALTFSLLITRELAINKRTMNSDREDACTTNFVVLILYSPLSLCALSALSRIYILFMTRKTEFPILPIFQTKRRSIENVFNS